MNKVASVVLITALVAVFSVKYTNGQCICTANYQPVCGTNGRTYSNTCQLNCERDRNFNLRVAYNGACRNNGNGNNGIGQRPGNNRPGLSRPTSRPNCFCTFQFDPVCGSDGRTYSNDCQLRCQSNARVAHRGSCRR